MCSDPAICGTSSACQTYSSCATYDAGIATSAKAEFPLTKYTYTCTELCLGPDYLDCSTDCTGSEPVATCNGVAAARKAAIVATVPAGAPGRSFWLSTFAVNGSSDGTETTTIKGGSFGKPLTTKTTYNYKCQLNIPNFPSPAVGPAEVGTGALGEGAVSVVPDSHSHVLGV
jgi:hypothetical protein